MSVRDDQVKAGVEKGIVLSTFEADARPLITDRLVVHIERVYHYTDSRIATKLVGKLRV